VRTTLVSDSDVLAVRSEFRPGLVVPFIDLYERYGTVMRRAGLPVASKEALGRALTRHDWERKVVRKARGRRGQQVVTETHCRVIPGAPVVDEEAERLGTLVLTLLDGEDHSIIPRDTVWPAYLKLVRQHGWDQVEDRKRVNRWLSSRGAVKMTEGGKRGPHGWPGVPSLYIHTGMVPMTLKSQPELPSDPRRM
jgi:hypothetical protein